jgi:molybdate transport system substrate-binding protein
VPAGAQARSCLIEAGLWEELGPRFVSTESVRAALGLLLQGAVDAAFVYRSDLRGQASLAEGLLLDESCARPLYAAVLLSGAADREAAGRVLEFLAGAEALAVFLQHGFLPPPEALPPS